MLDIFALIVILVVAAAIIALIVVIGNLPGKMARQRNHPQAEAIGILAWVGLFTAGIGWFAALIWATMKTESSNDTQQRLEAVEKALSIKQETESAL